MKTGKLFLMVVALLYVAGSSYSRAESDDEGDYEELRSSHSEWDSGKSDKNVNVKSKEQSKGHHSPGVQNEEVQLFFSLD